MTFWKWSRTASANSNSDSTCPFPEGMNPAALNDGTRAMMAAAAKYRDDSAGLATAGTATAYTVTTYQGFTSLANLDNARLVIIPHVTSGAEPTLSVDGKTAKPLRFVTGEDPPEGSFKAGTPYPVTYSNTNNEFVAHGLPAAFGATAFTDTITAKDIDAENVSVSGILGSTSTEHMLLPKGTTVQRPASPAAAMFRFNSTTNAPEFYDGAGWQSLAPPLPVPQGYLTPVSNTPIITGNAASQSTIYYTQLLGSWAVIHNGTTLIPYLMPSQFVLALTSSQAANGIYDIYLAFNGGAPVIGTGPSWASGTGGSVSAGSCARGTGTGGAALTRLNGVLVNAASMSLIWNTGSGNTTITVPANQGVFLGSILIDGSAGQVTCHRDYGSSRVWGISNAYNRRPTYLKTGVASATWTSTGGAIRPANNDAGVTCRVFNCLPEEPVETILQWSSNGAGSQGTVGRLGIGFNRTNGMDGVGGQVGNGVNTGQGAAYGSGGGVYMAAPFLGIANITEVELSNGWPMFGGENGNAMISKWLA